ncbi:MAG: hypothetical protein KC502_22695 [Myxococcales bacterium]|nr:hypothetical protein [Myxococcales bacterium]
MPNRRPHDHIGNFNFTLEVSGVAVPAANITGGELISDGKGGEPRFRDLHVQIYAADQNNALSAAAERVVNGGKNERFTITITELAKDKSSVTTTKYTGCLLRALKFPSTTWVSDPALAVETGVFLPVKRTVKVTPLKAGTGWTFPPGHKSKNVA